MQGMDGGLLSDIPAVDDEFGTGKMSAVGEYGHAVILSHPETHSNPVSVTMPAFLGLIHVRVLAMRADSY